jgi:endonuclease/exonuclease/phosphatase family metal-dependent hydrolase
MANVLYSSTRTTRLIHPLLLAGIVLCGAAGAASAQTTVTLSAPGTQISADLTIQGGASGMTDYSTSPVLASKVSSESFARRIFVKLNTEDAIPAGAQIQSAKLYLTLKAAESSQQRPFTAFNVTQSFVAGQTNWYYFRSGQAWSRSGGDLGSTYGTTSVANAVGNAYAFDLTNLVQHAVNGDFGSRYTRVALIDTGGADTGNYREFYSTRADNTSLRPRLVVTYTTSTTSSPSPAPPPPTAQTGTLKVMQWNVHKTKGSDGVCNPDRTASVIAAQNAPVVSLNEVNFFAGDCAWNFDMGEKLRGLLQQKTGVTWYMQSVNPNGVGNVLLSRYQPVSSSSFILDNGRGVAQMGIVINGRTVNVFSTHIEYDNASWRPAQIAEALAWLNNFSEPRVFMGDFNTWQGTDNYYTLTSVLTDGWLAGLNAGVASSYNGTGNTEGLSRIDYVFLRGSQLSINKITVPDTTVNGVRPSDHDPILATLGVK